jgi:hypothetical protein
MVLVDLTLIFQHDGGEGSGSEFSRVLVEVADLARHRQRGRRKMVVVLTRLDEFATRFYRYYQMEDAKRVPLDVDATDFLARLLCGRDDTISDATYGRLRSLSLRDVLALVQAKLRGAIESRLSDIERKDDIFLYPVSLTDFLFAQMLLDLAGRTCPPGGLHSHRPSDSDHGSNTGGAVSYDSGWAGQLLDWPTYPDGLVRPGEGKIGEKCT